MTIEVDVDHRLGAFRLAASFASEGGLTALFGRSGSGKTSLVNIVAGLVRPDRGRVVVDGHVLVDTAARRFVPPHRRRVGYVFQEGRLFPHMTVRRNLLYGRWFSPKGERGESLERVVDLLGIGHLLDRRPALLSGGEKQRVAIGRALLASPRMLLMDEPLAALDGARKAEILPYVERLRDAAGIPILYVSHSIEEVARLASTVVLLADGRVAAAGSPAEVLSRAGLLPDADRAEAGAILDTRVEAHDDRFGLTTLRAAAGPFRVQRLDLPVGAPVRIRVRARDVMLATEPPHHLSALNVIEGAVADVTPTGLTVAVGIACGTDRLVAGLTRLSTETLGIRPGRRVYAVIKTVAFDSHAVGATLRTDPAAETADAAASRG